MKKSILIILSFLLLQIGYSQGIIEIENPSYEGIPSHSTVADEWGFCTFESQSPPDIQPGFFGVNNHEAFDGRTYAGIVTRADGTFEMLRTKLREPLVKGTCYSWNFYISQSPNYLSISRKTLKEELFISPVNVVIYGAKTVSCKSMEPLVSVENIKRLDQWKPYNFIFTAQENYKYLVIAVHPVKHDNPVNGHVLIDYFTPLIPVDCETHKPKNIIVKKSEILLKNINTKKQEEKLKELIEKVDFNDLTKKGYLKYQFYLEDKSKLIYDNLYFNELMKAFPKESGKEIIMIGKEEFEGARVMKFLKSYIKQRDIDTNFLMLPFKEKLLKKYKESHTLLFEGEDVLIFVK